MIMIHLNTFEQIKRFLNISNRLDYELNLVSGRYEVNGKSIMGILGLDLSKPVEVKIVNQQNYYPQELEEFMVMQK